MQDLQAKLQNGYKNNLKNYQTRHTKLLNWKTQHSSDSNPPNLWIDLMQLKECGSTTKTLPPEKDFK